jgi:hypothetical protein
MSEPTDVTVKHGEIDGVKNTVISDRVSNREWSGTGTTHDESSTEATRKFIGDRRVREYIPS